MAALSYASGDGLSWYPVTALQSAVNAGAAYAQMVPCPPAFAGLAPGFAHGPGTFPGGQQMHASEGVIVVDGIRGAWNTGNASQKALPLTTSDPNNVVIVAANPTAILTPPGTPQLYAVTSGYGSGSFWGLMSRGTQIVLTTQDGVNNKEILDGAIGSLVLVDPAPAFATPKLCLDLPNTAKATVPGSSWPLLGHDDGGCYTGAVYKFVFTGAPAAGAIVYLGWPVTTTQTTFIVTQTYSGVGGAVTRHAPITATKASGAIALTLAANAEGDAITVTYADNAIVLIDITSNATAALVPNAGAFGPHP